MFFRDVLAERLIMKILLQAVLLAGLSGVCGAAIPQYTVAEPVYVNGTPLDVGLYGSPLVADWDNDGKQDLLVGRMYRGGRLNFYKNTGTNASPKLASYVKLQTDGDTNFLSTC